MMSSERPRDHSDDPRDTRKKLIEEMGSLFLEITHLSSDTDINRREQIIMRLNKIFTELLMTPRNTEQNSQQIEEISLQFVKLAELIKPPSAEAMPSDHSDDPRDRRIAQQMNILLASLL
jgi:hypothetical protein